MRVFVRVFPIPLCFLTLYFFLTLAFDCLSSFFQCCFYFLSGVVKQGGQLEGRAVVREAAARGRSRGRPRGGLPRRRQRLPLHLEPFPFFQPLFFLFFLFFVFSVFLLFSISFHHFPTFIFLSGGDDIWGAHPDDLARLIQHFFFHFFRLKERAMHQHSETNRKHAHLLPPGAATCARRRCAGCWRAWPGTAASRTWASCSCRTCAAASKRWSSSHK